VTLFRAIFSVLLCAAALMLTATPAAAGIDQRRLAAHQHAAEVAFPSIHKRTVHLNAGAVIDRTFPGEYPVDGMATDWRWDRPGLKLPPYQVYLRSGLSRYWFRYTLFHEMAHTIGWQHGRAMNRAVNRALRRASMALRG
jgi:hypothetical protein